MQTTHLCEISPVYLTKNLIAVIELLKVLNWARSEVVKVKSNQNEPEPSI